jgi:hypothetical protein
MFGQKVSRWKSKRKQVVMIRVITDWNPKQALLKALIQKPGRFEED